MTNPKFDVAISFLHQDQPLALELESKLSPPLRVFVYPRNQEDLAGKDGLEEFRDVFLNQSRLVVVLFRDGWGERSWTRVEQGAITDRFLRDGWDWLLFVMLDKQSTPPKWLPKTKIRLDLEEYGVEQCLGAIKARAQELGAAIRKPTLEEISTRLKQEKAFHDYRQSYLNSQQALSDANNEAATLFSAFESNVQTISDPKAAIVFTTKREYDSLSITCLGFMLYVTWNNEAANMLYNSGLFVRLYEKGRDELPRSRADDQLRRERTYSYDISTSKQSRWRENFGERRLLESQEIVDDSLKAVLEHIRSFLLQKNE